MPQTPDNSIIAVYDAAMNPVLWDDALDNCIVAVGARSSILVAQNSGDNNILDITRMSSIFREIPDLVAHYQARYMKYELPGWQNIASKPPLTLLTDKESWPLPDEVLKSREDYAYLLKHAGIFRKAAARLNGFNTWTDNIAFQFCQSMSTIPDQSMSTIRVLLPHIARSIELGRMFSLLRIQFNAVLEAMNHVAVGVCLVRENGYVMVSNTEAQRILSTGNEVGVDMNGILGSSSNATSAWLKKTIERCSATAIGRDQLHESSIVIKRSPCDEPLVVEIAPLRDTLSELSSDFNGSVVFLIDPGSLPKPSLEAMSMSCGLTAAEASVCSLLVVGHTNRQIADIRSVSIETVKTQISQILQKTRTRNRTELIRLAFRCMPPIIRQ